MMKPLFVKRSRAWLAVLAVGIFLIGAGLWQSPEDSSVLKGEGGGGAPAGDTQSAPKKALENSVVTADPALDKENKTHAPGDAKKNEFFVEYRLERDRTRSQQIDLYREIVNNQNSPDETRKEAQRRLLSITQAMETEMKLENLIKAENFKDSVVFVQDTGVTIIVETPVLTSLDKEKLTGIAVNATGFAKEKVVVRSKV